jgi:hypothetical protein
VPRVPDVVQCPAAPGAGRGQARADPGKALLSLPSLGWQAGTVALWQRDGQNGPGRARTGQDGPGRGGARDRSMPPRGVFWPTKIHGPLVAGPVWPPMRAAGPRPWPWTVTRGK